MAAHQTRQHRIAAPELVPRPANPSPHRVPANPRRPGTFGGASRTDALALGRNAALLRTALGPRAGYVAPLLPISAAQSPRFAATERRRNRTFQPVGCTGLPVLKTGWATRPLPLQQRVKPEWCARVSFNSVGPGN